MFSSFLPGRLGEDLDPRLQRRVGVLQPKLRPSAAEQAPEHRVEVLLDLVVGVQEQLGGFRADLAGDPLQVFARVRQVAQLAGEEVETVLDLGELLRGHEVHLAELAHLLPQLRQPRPQVAVGLKVGDPRLELAQVPGKPLGEARVQVLDLGADLRHLDLHLLDLRLGPRQEEGLLLQLLLLGAQLLVAGGDLALQAGERERADFSCSSISWRSFSAAAMRSSVSPTRVRVSVI